MPKGFKPKKEIRSNKRNQGKIRFGNEDSFMNYSEDKSISSESSEILKEDFSNPIFEMEEIEALKQEANELGEKNTRRNRFRSMDCPAQGIVDSTESHSLTGAIMMALKNHKILSKEEISKKIEPIFTLIRKNKKANHVMNDISKSVEGCLNALKNKVFKKNEKTDKWSLMDNNEINNYFTMLEKKIAKTGSKKAKPIRLNIKKRECNDYQDTITKLCDCLKYLGRNKKAYKIIKKNPFKKIKEVIPAEGSGKTTYEEEILAKIVSFQDPTKGGERLIGILQCFYYFYPIIKNALTSPKNVSETMLTQIKSAIDELKTLGKTPK
jgi:hypothetical protein